MKGNGFMKLARSPEDGKVGKMVHSLRSLGSAALNICQVATGGCDLVSWGIDRVSHEAI